jgi:hypothetical protein
MGFSNPVKISQLSELKDRKRRKDPVILVVPPTKITIRTFQY